MDPQLVTISEACEWASNYLNRKVTSSNIGYLIQYAKVTKHEDNTHTIRIDIEELKNYYDNNILSKQDIWVKKLGEDIDWELSFDGLSESERTKHVHRLHPYKGKFIPQLVEYFLDNHVDKFKKETYFERGDIILDPFMGSGTTLVQAAELGINSIGIDVSEFNCLIARVKTDIYDVFTLKYKLEGAFSKLQTFSEKSFDDKFDIELRNRISSFNSINFPVRDYKRQVYSNEIEEKSYSKQKLSEFFDLNNEFLEKNGLRRDAQLIETDDISGFISKWFTKRIQQEISFYIGLIEEEQDQKIANVMKIILSRTARSCRATTHSDLATLVEPQYGPYYCSKHFKICTPINSIIRHLRKNTHDTIDRLEQFEKLRDEGTRIWIIHGDSKNVNIGDKLKDENTVLARRDKRIIDGVFTSPPYVGQIDYHEQHAYSYEMFGIPRNDKYEIGSMSLGKGKKAKEEYVNGISKVLENISRFVKPDGNYFIVANDQFNLYPEIAEKSGFEIIKVFKRPVLNRTERDRQPYAESIFHMKKK